MTTIEDGPAAGQKLMLKRAPMHLRVVHGNNPEHEWDALDQPGDTPEPDEKIYAYETDGPHGHAHMLFSGKKRHMSGFYPMVSYRFIEPQPSEDTMRDNKKWAEWATTRGLAKGNKQ